MKFVWSETGRFVTGAGGTENHTLERARELQRRGMPVEIILVSPEAYDPGFSDLPYSFIQSANQLSEIDDTIIYIARGHDITTIRPSYLFLHFPVGHVNDDPGLPFRQAASRSHLITNSRFSQTYWAGKLDVEAKDIAVVYPFAHPAFAAVPSQRSEGVCQVFYPNRIVPEKGLFIFLEAASMLNEQPKYEFVIAGAGNQTDRGKQAENLLQTIAHITYLPPATTREHMAQLYSRADIVVVPSWNDYWQEPFGMTSVEGQHAGCRVIASDSGGLGETDCGLLDLVEPGDAYELARQIETVSHRPPVSVGERHKAAEQFTLAHSVDSFLTVIGEQPGTDKIKTS